MSRLGKLIGTAALEKPNWKRSAEDPAADRLSKAANR